MKHVLIVGTQGVGKSTLINKIKDELGRPVWGFETKKEKPAAKDKASPIYIYPAGKERVRGPDNLVGYCTERSLEPVPEGFERFAPYLAEEPPEGCVILMDEIGVAESAATDFCRAILDKLDKDTLVIAAVKDKSTPFLNQVRNHPNAKCFYINEENRGGLFSEVMDFLDHK
ncbi:MAG: nucleoside-triphosphatase [Lachnospiraceae bacterium]|jgi:nucleoside-triphosphatase THEP1